MKSCSIIIQGEGKGHFSQALEACRILQKENITIHGIYLGRSIMRKTPDYFRTAALPPLKFFLSPNFIHTPDKRGIRIFSSIVVNLLLAPVYLFETFRLGILLKRDKSSHIFNFYDPVGLLASKWFGKGVTKVVLSHHFYLSHPDFIHPYGMENSYFWLQLMNRIMMRSAHRVVAFSFREGEMSGKIEVHPPLIDAIIREGKRSAGDSDLCYFLNPGYVTGILNYYANNKELTADIFTDGDFSGEIPPNVKIHKPSRDEFINRMLRCRRIIATGGFDTVAEAFYLGIPLFLIPAENHYEQYCNTLDASRTGMAFQLEGLENLEDVEFEPRNNAIFRKWAERDGVFQLL